jgi:hypothetical protein
MRRVAPYILTLLLGVVIGGFLFSKSIKRSLLAAQSCDEECLQPKDLAGLLGSLGIQHATTLLPFYEAQSKECVAVRHPKPEGNFHLVFLPKRDVRNVLELTQEDIPFLVGCLALAREQVAKAGVRNYRFVTYGPELQHVTYFHFHVIAK